MALTHYQNLLELMKRPLEMCCVECRERTPWGRNEEDDTLQKAGPTEMGTMTSVSVQGSHFLANCETRFDAVGT